ncbi:MAG: LysR family transcriptional regulator [Colwellia sp.]
MMHTLEQKLARVDLNLLISLSVLLKERSVSRAADKLYLSQSAMSRTLQRLRDVFSDPLFHRTANGIMPTEKALAIESMLPDLLQSLESILHDETFEAKRCDKHFGISLPASLNHAIFLPLVKKVCAQAPLVQLTSYSASSNPYKHLESGLFDFSLHVEKPFDSAFNAYDLGDVYPVIFARKGHPLCNKENATLKQCLKYAFVDLNTEESTDVGFINPIDKLLMNQGGKRKIQYKSSQLSILIEILKTSDSLIIGPESLMSSDELNNEFVAIYSFDKTAENAISFYLLEHVRVENSKPHQWLKDIIIDTVALAHNE